MNILFLCNDGTYYGSPAHEIGVAQSMAELGNDVYVFCNKQPIFWEEIPEKLHIISDLPIENGKPTPEEPTTEAFMKLPKKPDVIFMGTISFVDIAILLGKTFNIPVVSQVLDVPLHMNHYVDIWMKYWSKFIVHSNIITVNNDETKNGLVEIFNRCRIIEYPKIIRVPYGINTRLYDYIPNQSERYQAIIISRLSVHRNIQNAIIAFSQIDPAPELVIVGEGRELENLKKLSEELKVNCRFTGAIKDKEKIKEIKRSMFVINPSADVFIPALPPAEGLYCGKPAMCMNTPIMSGQYGNSVEGFHDLRSMIDTIIHLTNNPDYRTKRGDQGRNFVKETMSCGIIAKRLINIFEEL